MKKVILIIIISIVISSVLMAVDWKKGEKVNNLDIHYQTKPINLEQDKPEIPGTCKLCGWSCILFEFCGRCLPG